MVRSGYQPDTMSSSARRADFDLLRRVTNLEQRVTDLEAYVVSNDVRITVIEDALAAYGLRGAHVSFTFNATTTAPPIGNQLRLNNASQTAATHIYVSHTTTDGMDVTAGLTNIQIGDIIYFQDFDDSTKWVRYTVTSTTNHPTPAPPYHDFGVTYLNGPANVPFQKIELMPIYPNKFP